MRYNIFKSNSCSLAFISQPLRVRSFMDVDPSIQVSKYPSQFQSFGMIFSMTWSGNPMKFGKIEWKKNEKMKK